MKVFSVKHMQKLSEGVPKIEEKNSLRTRAPEKALDTQEKILNDPVPIQHWPRSEQEEAGTQIVLYTYWN